MHEWLATYGWAFATGVFVVWALLMTVLAGIDPRRLDGESTWAKPFKFAISLAIHFATFAVLALYLPPAERHGGALLSALIVALGAGLFAQGYITVQAMRRRRSHFNTSTELEAALLAVTAFCALVVLAPAVVIGLEAAATSLPGWTAATRAGVATGLLIGAFMTTVTGFQMGANGSHFVGRPRGEPQLMKLTGWALDAPDLRPAHFLANHMMQAVPLASAVFTISMGQLPALILTVAFCCLWVTLTFAASQRAMARRGLPGALKILA